MQDIMKRFWQTPSSVVDSLVSWNVDGSDCEQRSWWIGAADRACVDNTDVEEVFVETSASDELRRDLRK